jgi:leucine dehydrogenase
MTFKCALADLPHGGGKTVAVLREGKANPETRRDLVLDIADTVADFGGRYITGPDIGSTPRDMALIHNLAHGWAFCRPTEQGGSGDSSIATARGVVAALNAGVARVHGRESVAGLRIGVIGFGNVGRLVSQTLAANGAYVIVTDINADLRSDAERCGVTWTAADLLLEQLDVLVPAATGGLLTAESVATCQTPLIVGPANNQLADEDVAVFIQRRGIAWVPDVLASSGGIIHAVCREELALDEAATNVKIAAIGTKAAHLLDLARTRKITTLRAAQEIAAHGAQATTR